MHQEQLASSVWPSLLANPFFGNVFIKDGDRSRRQILALGEKY
jgi:hypothetical protein